MSPKVAPQLRQTRPFAGLGTTVVLAVRVMRRLPPHLPRGGPSSRAGRNWHLPALASGGCRGFIGPCPSAPLDEWNGEDSTGRFHPPVSAGGPRPRLWARARGARRADGGPAPAPGPP